MNLGLGYCSFDEDEKDICLEEEEWLAAWLEQPGERHGEQGPVHGSVCGAAAGSLVSESLTHRESHTHLLLAPPPPSRAAPRVHHLPFRPCSPLLLFI